MLVPAQWQGSVEHFYHFLLGYFVPVVLWQELNKDNSFALRDCGPMNPWFDLLAPNSDVEFLQPGVMLERTLTHRQAFRVLHDWDNPSRFHNRSLRKVSRIIVNRCADTPEEPHSDLKNITVIERGERSDFYEQGNSEVSGSGAEIRSVPNLAEVTQSLKKSWDVRHIDAAKLSPLEQVQSFSQTDILIAQHGAGISNSIWLKPGSTVVEIAPPLPPTIDNIFLNLAAALGLRYARISQEHEHAPLTPQSIKEIERQISSELPGSAAKATAKFPINLIRQLPRSL